MSASPGLILLRHAHRDLSDPAADNGLSEKGKRQSRRILKYLKRRFRKGSAETRRLLLFSSPRRRCIETMQPLGRYVQCKLAVSELFVERQEHESLAAFHRRIGGALRALARKNGGTVILCSHGDWLPVAIKRLCGASVELKKGGLAEIEDRTLVRLLEPSDL